MPLNLPARFATPEMRTGLFYATYFMPAAVSGLLLPIWLTERGIVPEQIGIISATPIFIMIVLNLVVGRVADRARDWRSVIVGGAMISASVSFGFVFVEGFWSVLLFNTLIVIPFMATEPVLDAAAMRMTRRRGTDFARVRIWGTLGYIAMTTVAGVMLGWVGIAVFVPLIIGVCLLRGGLSLALPYFRAPAGYVPQPGLVPGPDTAQRFKEILRPWFVLTLAGTALLQSSHMLMASFGALLWVQAGVSEAMVGVLWAVAPICEMAAILFFSHFSRRFSARHMLLAACLVGIVRWVGMTLATEVWHFVLLQSLHMATFGLVFMGIVTFIANWTSEAIAAQAQSFYVVMRQVASVCALVVFGRLVGTFGFESYLAPAVMAGAGGAMILVSLLLNPAKR